MANYAYIKKEKIRHPDKVLAFSNNDKVKWDMSWIISKNKASKEQRIVMLFTMCLHYIHLL